MSAFFETKFGPAELEILEKAFAQWCVERGVSRQSPDAALAAEVFINLFREGNKTSGQLRKAASRHKWLCEGRPGT